MAREPQSEDIEAQSITRALVTLIGRLTKIHALRGMQADQITLVTQIFLGI